MVDYSLDPLSGLHPKNSKACLLIGTRELASTLIRATQFLPAAKRHCLRMAHLHDRDFMLLRPFSPILAFFVKTALKISNLSSASTFSKIGTLEIVQTG